MDYAFTREQERIRSAIREFLRKECPKEYIRRIDEEKEYPMDLYKKMAELGWLGLSIPEEYGGVGGDIVDQTLMIEELARYSSAIAISYLLNVCFGAKSIMNMGTEEQKEKYLPKIASGDLTFCLGLTESSSGTDALSLSTRAVKDGDHYIVNGQKTYITGAHVADYIILVARSGPCEEKRTRNITIFLVDTGSKGVKINLLNKIGNKAAGTTEIFLDNVVVPVENVLGTEHKGWYQLVDTLNNERISVAAICLGITQAVIDESLKYVLERKAFDKPIGQFQYIQKYITDMVMGLEAARLLSYKAAWLQSRAKKCNVEAAMAKLLASEVAFNATCSGMRIFAGYGYMVESDIQRLWHDSELWIFAPISNEMTRNHLAAELGLPRSY